MTNDVKIYAAIDTDNLDHALSLAKQLSIPGMGIKLGMTFFNSQGPSGVKKIKENTTASIFLDLKFHDIPATVAGAVRSVAPLGIDYINVHASGGTEMMQAAKEAAGNNGPKVLAVTVLTSLNDENLTEVGQQTPANNQVLKLANLTNTAGLDGIVCSAHEIETIRAEIGDNFVLMVPGIRPAGSDTGDQKRIMTPIDAIDKGATHLVIGRPITRADNPAQAAKEILDILR